MKPTEQFLAQAVEFVDVPGSRIAYRRFGSGPPLIFIHGWPFHSFNYRLVIPEMAHHFTCYALDLPGCGLTEWTDATDFSFLPGQVGALHEFVTGLGLTQYSVIAHDTGATIARYLSVRDRRLRRLVMLNTESPGHRPPWIPLYRTLMALPWSGFVLSQLLRSKLFLRSSAGFGGAFADMSHLEGDFERHIIAPALASPRRVEGLRRYLRGLDWKLVDELTEIHARMEIPVLIIWGAQDLTFPLSAARDMVAQIPDCRGLHEIQGARLLPQEERPQEVARLSLDFLRHG